MKTSYSEQLKDPRWQKRRLHILERDGWACRRCQSKDKTLHVHHALYRKGAKPWEYEDEALVTVCDKCHAILEEERDVILLSLSRNPENSYRLMILSKGLDASKALGIKWLTIRVSEMVHAFAEILHDQVEPHEFKAKADTLKWQILECLMDSDREAQAFCEESFQRNCNREEDS